MRALVRLLLLCVLSVWSADSTAQELHRCTRVLDGDTIELAAVGRVRLIGVNCPEPGERANGDVGFAAEATDYTRSLVEGKLVWLDYDRERRDKFGRTLAYVFLEDSSFVNALIVYEGYGTAYTRFPFRYADWFRNLEREAREAGRGRWGAPGGLGDPSLGAVSRELRVKASDADTATVVYVTRTGKKYHREGCRSLARSSIPIALGDAAHRYGPCRICSPPTLQGGGAPGVREQNLRRSAPAATGRCQATTRKGAQCKRNARSGSSYCWQHGG